MSGAISKRQATRNEKALRDLVHNTPGNNFCADCQARNPAWASWSLGIFLCMRCAAIHRKLGTHISKVKSLSMDSWSNEQVDNMRKVGNLASNKIYNPQGKKPQIPIDADEADSAMERFIRQKYTNNGLKSTKRNSHGSIVSDEGTPPPLPPKTPSKFGLKSASSLLSLGSRKKDRSGSGPPSRDGTSSPRPSPRADSSPRNKSSRGFGASIDYGVGDETEQKLASLRDMGFTDDQRNTLILKGMHGNIEKTVEALVRLGEGGRSSSLRASQDVQAAGRTLTPIKSPHGLSLAGSAPTTAQSPASATSNNPFDNIQPVAQPQSSQSTGTIGSTNNPFLQHQQQHLPTNNPFGLPQHSQPNLGGLNQSFSRMSLAPAPSLFPNHTGGVPTPQATSQPYQQSMTPPVQSTQNFAPVNFNSTMSYPPVQPLQQQATGYNPFLQTQSAQSSPGLGLNTNGVQGSFGSNPFTRSPTRMQSPSPLAQIPETAQSNVYSSPQPLQSPSTNPFFTAAPTSAPLQAPSPFAQQPQQQQPQVPYQSQAMQSQQQQPQPQFQPQQQQQQPMMYQQQPLRPDKASIMALYNYPQLAPAKPTLQTPATSDGNTAGDVFSAPLGQQPQMSPRRAVSTPLTGSNNPFIATTATNPAGAGGTAGMAAAMTPRSENVAGMIGGATGMATGGMGGVGSGSSNHASRDSVSLGMDLAWTSTNGRHSPDAFASLSSRAGR